MPIKTISLSEWVEAYTTDLYSWALHKVSDPELAKDLVQDTFLVAAEKIDAHTLSFLSEGYGTD